MKLMDSQFNFAIVQTTFILRRIKLTCFIMLNQYLRWVMKALDKPLTTSNENEEIVAVLGKASEGGTRL